jgi:queuine tRNA-ribosyltransferase
VDNKKICQKIIKTAHGSIKTPFFMPDATRGFIKLLDKSDLKKAGVGPMVVNTYHLYLRPGLKIIKKAGGIHKFMNWDGPLLSDSGGFQVFSLIHKKPGMGKILDDKVIFTSPIDGSKHELTPEKSIQIQFALGTDMMVCLDDCPPNTFNQEQMKASVARTITWAKRCKKEFQKRIKNKESKIKNYQRPLLFAVIQGGTDLALRKYCAEELIKIGFDGYGFGAMPVDADGNFLEEVLKYTADLIPKNALRFALGVGSPTDIIKCASYGWDMFDCVIPTREGRHGKLFNYQLSIINYQLNSKSKTKLQSRIKNQESRVESFNILNARFANDLNPINSNSKILELKNYSRAFLHHLFKANDPLGQRLASLNNLEFYMELIKKLKSS